MIHRFLRESNQLKLKFTPNYARFKWMARHVFHYVGLDRTMSLMAESLTQRMCTQAERAAARRIARGCVEHLREE
jgi:hypothetical protein